MAYNETPTKGTTVLNIRAIKFTLETLPKIHAEYPRTAKIYMAEIVQQQYADDDYYFVNDPYAPTPRRVMSKKHFEDVYETPASEIGNDFKVIY